MEELRSDRGEWRVGSARALASTSHPIEAYALRVALVHGETRDGSARIAQEFHRADGGTCKCILREGLQWDGCPAGRLDHQYGITRRNRVRDVEVLTSVFASQ